MLGGLPLFCSICHCPIGLTYRYDLTGRIAHIECMPEPSEQAKAALEAVLCAVTGTAKPMAVPITPEDAIPEPGADDTADLLALLKEAKDQLCAMPDLVARIDAAISKHNAQGANDAAE